MTAGIRNSRVFWLAVALLLPLPVCRSQTNEVAAPPPPAPPQSDPDRFFDRYKLAVRLVKQNAYQEAAVAMDLLWRNLGSSPWLEIALLKHAELTESRNDQVAFDDYRLLEKRLLNAPYYQGDAEKARLFRASLQGAVQRGVDRIRIRRVVDALDRYHTRYFQYPESLAKLSIFNYVEFEDIHNSGGRMIRYTPTGQQFTPSISYQRYEIEAIPPEPFYVTTPRLDGTSQESGQPLTYVALIRVPGRMDAQRVKENQTLEGYFVAAVAAGGVVVCTPERVLVLPVPE